MKKWFKKSNKELLVALCINDIEKSKKQSKKEKKYY